MENITFKEDGNKNYVNLQVYVDDKHFGEIYRDGGSYFHLFFAEGKRKFADDRMQECILADTLRESKPIALAKIKSYFTFFKQFT